jgi:hypothetical protein
MATASVSMDRGIWDFALAKRLIWLVYLLIRISFILCLDFFFDEAGGFSS